MGAFEVQLDLLPVHPLLPGGSPLTVRRRSNGWKPFTRTETVPALRLMIGSCGRDPAQYALHSGRIGGGNAAGGAGRARASNPARRQVEVSRIRDVYAGGRGRGRFCLRRTYSNGVDGVYGLVVDGTEDFIVRLALWCEMLRSPAGEGAGHKFPVSLSHQFAWGFPYGIN